MLIHIESICLYICEHVILIMNILVHAYDEYMYTYIYIYTFIDTYKQGERGEIERPSDL